jgi:hypothetical protein
LLRRVAPRNDRKSDHYIELGRVFEERDAVTRQGQYVVTRSTQTSPQINTQSSRMVKRGVQQIVKKYIHTAI